MAKKRGSGEGNIRKLRSGNWSGQIMDGYRNDGKRRIISFSAPTRSKVLDKIREYKEQKEKSSGAESEAKIEVPSFHDFASRWYASYRNQVEASTYSSYYYTLKVLNQYFASMPIDQVKTTAINQCMNDLQERGYSTSLISKCRAMLTQIFDVAEADDIVEKNYARRAFTSAKKRKLGDEKVQKKDAFSPEEFSVLMKCLPENLIGYSIRLLLVTGIRVQELLALTPEDFSKNGDSVRICKAVKIVNGYPILGVTKSRSSERVVPIPKEYRYISQWLQENGGQVYLWCDVRRTNLLYDTGYFRRKYYLTIEAIPAVRRLSPHCCRHTYVSLLQSQGVAMETIARLTGHSDITTTGNYLHISADTLQKAVALLGDI